MTHPLLQRLRHLELPKGEHALFGSGPLLARGWIDDVGDLDVLARGAAWDRAQVLGELVHLEEYAIDVVHIDEHITVGTRWAIGDFQVDELIDTAEPIAGIPCVRLEHVISYKQIAGRPKDRMHLEVIERNLDDERNSEPERPRSG